MGVSRVAVQEYSQLGFFNFQLIIIEKIMEYLSLGMIALGVSDVIIVVMLESIYSIVKNTKKFKKWMKKHGKKFFLLKIFD